MDCMESAVLSHHVCIVVIFRPNGNMVFSSVREQVVSLTSSIILAGTVYKNNLLEIEPK